jgi:hypothetical protein
MKCLECSQTVEGKANVVSEGVLHTTCVASWRKKQNSCRGCEGRGWVDDSAPGGTYLPCRLCTDCPTCGSARKDGKSCRRPRSEEVS